MDENETKKKKKIRNSKEELLSMLGVHCRDTPGDLETDRQSHRGSFLD